MKVSVTMRHQSLSEELHDLTERRSQRLARFEPRLGNVSVVFDEEGERSRAEVRAEVAGGSPVVARAGGPTHRTALDRALDRAIRQLKRQRERRHDHQAPPPDVVEPDPDASVPTT
jgi:ribosomal subunit interface protein